MEVRMMEVEAINKAVFNPSIRIEPNRIDDLLTSIESNGIESPLLVGCDGVLGDGHRRLACAIKLGYKTVPVIKSINRTGAQIYSDNSTQKPTRGAEWLQAVTHGYPIIYVPTKYRTNIQHMQRIHSARELLNIADMGQSPTIIQFARFVGNHIGDTSDAMLRKIILWFIKHGIQYKARKAIEDGCDPATVLQAIEEDRPIAIIYK